ncbi:tyrosine-type recombinase/integrase [Sandarakinorhabdus rubra]|uniref:tyrosine-type recombinase/integrase n=1 Tax=Sandarakinorhabdus rubra TaxID=2672568 RepID=UPI0013DC38C7|nr:integrase arm-type DNA-binding domain-containing protein [Sandarakinorhabdus rubra]
MPKRLQNALTVNGVKAALKQPGRYADGQGLFLEVKSATAASWILRYKSGEKMREKGLGSAFTLELVKAREAAAKVRTQVAEGHDPLAEREAAKLAPTFKVLASEVLATLKPGWRNAKHAHQWEQTLEAYAYPTIGEKTVDSIDAQDLLAVLQPIWLTKHETARRVRQRLAAVLDFAFSQGWRPAETPMRAISRGLPKRSKPVRHIEAMPYADIATFMAELRTERQGMGALALEALILTAARSGDIRGATWDEIDLMGKLWSIPANRMKRPRPHLIPLSDAAVAVFQKALELRTGEEPLCFPGIVRTRATATQPAMAKPLSDASLKAVLVRMGRTALPHGFRSTFKDWVSEVARYPNELSEAALAHAIKDKTEAAYRRGDLLERRREMMDAWATWCEVRPPKRSSASSAGL